MRRFLASRAVTSHRAWLPLVLALLIATFMLVGHGLAATDAGSLNLSVRDTQVLADGTTEIIVSVTGDVDPEVPLPPEAFKVTEQGALRDGLEVEPIFEEAGALEVTVALAIDVSGSMAGEPLELTQAGASDLVEVLVPLGFDVRLVTFADEVALVDAPPDDAAALVAAIEALTAGGETALYDAIERSLDVLAEVTGQVNLVVFSDGEDTASTIARQDAIARSQADEVAINIVALESADFSAEAVEDLASLTGGQLLAAAETTEVEGAFDRVAADLTSQYRLTYTSELVDTDVLELEVAVDHLGASETISYIVPNLRDASATAPDAAGPSTREVGDLTFAGRDALIVGIIAAFLATLLLLAILLTGQRTKADRVLGEQMARYLEKGDLRAGRSGLVAAHFRDRAMQLLEAAPAPEGFNERLTIRLEQAAWPLRNGEFLALVLLGAIAPAVLAGVVFNPLGGLLLGVLTGLVPIVILENRRAKRQDAFLKTLPDTLQLMAGSLRAGYGVLQAVDTVAKESTGPTAEEFTRVLTEARLGMPIEEALEAMGDRIGSMDLRWVVLAINIQREVGGNLAELLDTVSEVLREREMLRRQIKVLSAEGRLSAVILVLLPIFLAVYLVLVRPEYVGILVQSGLMGYAMIVGAILLMLVGIVWIRKLVQIEV